MEQLSNPVLIALVVAGAIFVVFSFYKGIKLQISSRRRKQLSKLTITLSRSNGENYTLDAGRLAEKELKTVIDFVKTADAQKWSALKRENVQFWNA